MKYLFLIIIFISSLTAAQDKNKSTIDTTKNKKMLIGYCDRSAFADTAFTWFDEEYEKYEIDESALEIDRSELKDITIHIVMGTWCSDSREQIPRLYKILDYLKIGEDKITLISIDRNKKAESLDLNEYVVEKVPTIIVYKDGFEMGRIIETPEESLEADLSNYINIKL